MKIYTIKQKMSNSGSIHDIASYTHDREIRFPKGSLYAIVLASYYVKQYTTHRSEAATIRKAHQQRKYSFQIIDSEGNRYFDNGNGHLEAIE